MARIQLLTFVAAATLALSGCQSAGPHLSAGAVSAYAPPTGAMTGGVVGSQIGLGLAAAERRTALDTEYRALELGRTGAPVAWRGRSGARGEVVAGPLYQINDYDCRDYTHTITIAGEVEAARGTACRRPNGNWRPVG